MRKHALSLFGLAAALLVGNTSAFAAEVCDDSYTDCEEAATALQGHRKADCRNVSECEGVVDKKFDADKTTCEAAKKRCEAADAQREAVKAARKDAKDKTKVLASLGAGGCKVKGKLKKPATKPDTAVAQTASCAADTDAKSAADKLLKRFADARTVGANRAFVPPGQILELDKTGPRNPPPAAPVRP